MIKLKSILKEIFQESGMVSNSGEYDLEIELNGIHIPGLLRPEETIKINASLPYDIDRGYSERGQYSSADRAEQGEGPSVELSEPEIAEVFISEGSEEDREIDMRFLHPNQKKEIERLVDNYVDDNKNTILDNIEGKL